MTAAQEDSQGRGEGRDRIGLIRALRPGGIDNEANEGLKWAAQAERDHRTVAGIRGGR